MRTFSQLLGMPLVTVAEGIQLGMLRGLDFDATDGQIRSLYFSGEQGRADGVLPWSAVLTVGQHAITIESVASVSTPDLGPDRVAAPPDVRNRPVLTEGGTRIGKVTGYDVDETTGRIQCYHVATGGLFGKLTHQEVTFPHASIRVFGPDAIVVANEVLSAVARPKTTQEH